MTALLLLLFLLSTPALNAQAGFPQDYFRSPIDFTPSLSGTFAEIRTGHFHSGIDYRTQGVEGKPIYAAANGFVSRIRISPVGFGKAIYIEHPNGYTTVYAHLRNFIPRIQQYVINEQYKRESFDVNLYPEPQSIRVQKGEVIAWGGNSGSSSGPHLHFEIRHTHNQNPINPKLFGLNIKDDIPPVIQALKIYPTGILSSVNGQHKPLIIETNGSHGRYKLEEKRDIQITGDVAFGVQVYDKHNHSNFRNGVNAFCIRIDDKLAYEYRIDEFSFAETRYVNAVIDYEEFMRSKRRFIQTRILPNNPLTIFPVAENRGVFSFTGNVRHLVQITVWDAAGNLATLEFNVTAGKANPGYQPDNQHKNKVLFRYNQLNRYQTDSFLLELPSNSLYDDIWFDFRTGAKEAETVADLFHVHDIFTPVHRNYIIAIKPDIPANHLKEKAVVVRKDDNDEWVSEGGAYVDGFVTATVRSFGEFSVMLDTIPPIIEPLNIRKNKNIERQTDIRIKISDELSGIKVYRGTMNGKWILMDYDPKNDLLVYEIDEQMLQGENHFMLVVEDQVGNISEYSTGLIR